MYAKGKGSQVPSDGQAREKLALYVYEYLTHIGAKNSAQTFLSEAESRGIRWEKNITLGESPGFLQSWWCVFWDLYCAAPERRETCEHSSEAKAFHDYGFVQNSTYVNGIAHNAAPSPMPQGAGGPVNQEMQQGPMPPGFFPAFMQQRFQGPRGPGNVRMMMPPQYEGQPLPGGPVPSSMEGMRPGMPGGPAGMQGVPRMNHVGRMPGPINSPINPAAYPPGMRVPHPNSMVPAGMGPQMGQPRWPPSSTAYSSSASPVTFNVNGPQPGPPGTPIIQSPQGSVGPFSPNNRMPLARTDSVGSESMYGGPNSAVMMNKSHPGMPPMHPMPGVSHLRFHSAIKPEYGMVPEGMMGPDMSMMNGANEMDMKQSPATSVHTPRDEMGPGCGPGGVMQGDMVPPQGPGQPGYGQMPPGAQHRPPGPFPGEMRQDQHESAAIMKIKESMEQEAKRFEDPHDPGAPPGQPPDFFPVMN